MHKEYRVVATIDELHGYNNKKYHYDAVSCWFDGRQHKFRTTDYNKAVEFLERAKRECPKFDKKTEIWLHDYPKNAIQYVHSNIRIESRTVSDWGLENDD